MAALTADIQVALQVPISAGRKSSFLRQRWPDAQLKPDVLQAIAQRSATTAFALPFLICRASLRGAFLYRSEGLDGGPQMLSRASGATSDGKPGQ